MMQAVFTHSESIAVTSTAPHADRQCNGDRTVKDHKFQNFTVSASDPDGMRDI